MKARVNTTYNYNKNITLSIGMILKNEENMLPTCLECIKPLLDNVKSELVIVDTGSTDKTIEIAKKYTDQIHHFDWIDDFAAARNFGLEKCSGQWFMFLDADDHFVDISDMIEFFNNENINKDYNCGFYTTHNFTSTRHDEYVTLRVERVARRADDLRFEGVIHEGFANLRHPAYYFKSYANHYGYAYETKEAHKKKALRNLTLIEKELEKNPDDMRTLGHLYGCFDVGDKRKLQTVEKMLNIAENNNNPVAFMAYFQAFDLYELNNQPSKAIDVIDKAIKKAKPDNAILGEAYGCKGSMLYGQGKFSEAEEALKKYLDYYKMNDAGKLDKSALGYVVSNHLKPEKFAELTNALSFCLVKQSRGGEALAVYEDIDLESASPALFKDTISTAVKIAMAVEVAAPNEINGEKASAYPKLVELYGKVVKLENCDKTAYFEQRLEELYYLDMTLADAFISCEKVTGRFAELMRICANNLYKGDERATALEKFLADGKLEKGYSEAIFLALKHNIDLTSAIEKIDCDLCRTHFTKIAQNKTELPAVSVKYKNDEFYLSSVKNLMFGVMLFEASVMGAGAVGASKMSSVERSPEVLSEVYENLSKYAALYVANVYNPDLLNPSDIGVLPETHRFGYYMGAARKELENGNPLGYIKELKTALVSCNSMGRVIKYLLEEFSKTL